MIKLYTIGFTQKSARYFFELLLEHNVRKLIDTRISNASQLSGFAKGNDLEYLAEAVGHIKYSHVLNFAPTKELLDSYRKKEIDWDDYATKYLELLAARKIEHTLHAEELDHSCLLCSEHLPAKCHRRLLAEYIANAIPNTAIIHLK